MIDSRPEIGLRGSGRMSIRLALQVLADLRTNDQIVVTHMGSAREWPKLWHHPLDLHYVPSTMGGAVPLGLGLAIAQPHREVLICTGDGALLMSLGCLVTVVASRATNVTIVVMDNGVYEVTGGQKTPASLAESDFAGFARAAGFYNVAHCWDHDDWRRRAPTILAAAGPRFVRLQVAPVSTDFSLAPPRPMHEQIASLRQSLAKSDGQRQRT
jgi:thiamine pyrophosphate-dependent acetolactate synthase large subunit-like protein